jgi:cytochrome c-type biogenesis protein CcmH/NrfF
LRTEPARGPLAALLLALLLTAPVLADGDAPGGGHGVAVDPLPVESGIDVDRLQWLYENVVCACPKENWSKTLAACPDGCAIPQKMEIQRAIVAGLGDDEIIDQQVALHGAKARADPGMRGAGAGAYFLPVVALFIFSWIAGAAVRRWSIDGRAARESRRDRQGTLSAEDVARIERDLSRFE